MRFSTSAVLVTMLGWLGASTAHNIQLKAHSRECFHEKLHKDDTMTVTFQVGDREFGGSGNLEIDFWVHTPLDSFRYIGADFSPPPLLAYRSKILPVIASISEMESHQKTTRLLRSEMENSLIASAMRLGHRIRKRFLSMSME